IVDLVRAEFADLAAAEQRAALPLPLLVRFLVAAAAASAGSSWTRHLTLHPVEPIVVGIVQFLRPAPFARLAHRRQPAAHPAPLGIGLALRARPLDHLLLFVHAHHHV